MGREVGVAETINPLWAYVMGNEARGANCNKQKRWQHEPSTNTDTYIIDPTDVRPSFEFIYFVLSLYDSHDNPSSIRVIMTDSFGF